MRKRWVLVFFLTLAAISLSVPASAELKFKWGPYLRVRHEYMPNWKDMDNDQLDNRNYFRVKASLWGQADYEKDLSIYAKLTDEFKAYTYFGDSTASVPDKTASKKGYHFDINEVVFDNLYLDVRNFLDLPVDLRLGRQDFLGTYGEGFLIMDGTPQDGARTYYFNAAKAAWKINDKNSLDIIYMNDPRDEELLPVINRTKLINARGNRLEDKKPLSLNVSDEEGYVLYWKNKAFKNLALDGYYIFKSEEEEGGGGYQAEKTRLNTIGSFAKYNLSPWAFRGQFASQFGHYGHNNRRGFGGYGYIDRSFKDFAWEPAVSIGYNYLSGDKRGNIKNEGWDPLFSRYPWISELYVSSISAETGIPGYWTNIQAYRLELLLKPTKKTKLSLWYNFLRANAQVASSVIFSGSGKDRGHLPQVKLEYAFNKNVSTYFLGEYFIPGNFYKDRDPSMFLRTELQIKF
jgi:hypothetical protein